LEKKVHGTELTREIGRGERPCEILGRGTSTLEEASGTKDCRVYPETRILGGIFRCSRQRRGVAGSREQLNAWESFDETGKGRGKPIDCREKGNFTERTDLDRIGYA